MELLKTVSDKFSYLPFLAQLFREKTVRFTAFDPGGEAITTTSLFLDGDVLVEVFEDQSGNLLAEQYPDIVDLHLQTIKEKIDTLKSLDKHVRITTIVSFVLTYLIITFNQLKLLLQYAYHSIHEQTPFPLHWAEIFRLAWALLGSLIISVLFRFILKRAFVYIIKRLQ